MAHRVVHFEIPADDVESLAGFYRELFGWKIERAPMEMDYWLIETGPEGEGINGGMMRRQMPEQGPVNYVSVESVEEYTSKAAQLGAMVIMPKQPVPGVGYVSVVLDPQRNMIGMFQDDPSVK